MIKALIFDCFGVLYVDSGSAFYQKHIPNYDVLHPQIKEIDAQFDYGLITLKDHNEQIAELTGLQLPFVEAHIESEHTRNKELLLYAQSLRPEYKIGLLSNIGPQAMDGFFSMTERAELFDAVVLSGDVGITKPHPRIYELIAEQLGLQPYECVMIDDLAANCAGADAAGMKSVHYTTNIQTLRDLEPLLTH